MIDLNKTVEDALDNIWSPKQYPAYSMAARKDFVPFSSKDGYNFPNQENQAAGFPPTTPQPPNPSSLPWPMQNITTDLADAMVYVLAASSKIGQCVKNNSISLSDDQKKQMIVMYKKLAVSLKNIRDVGLNITQIVDMAGELPPQVPVAPVPSEPESIK